MKQKCKLGIHKYVDRDIKDKNNDEFIYYLKEEIRKDHGFSDIDIVKIKICSVCGKPVITFKFLNDEYEKTW